ncbi:phosphatase PAP2 family protein [Ilumatobacter sp.]|uniref:phosphatase PAP2 family protein n=1 Tax=Ilumatobacter sp. TaxID=1967498 RepID=UPI003B5282F4
MAASATPLELIHGFDDAVDRVVRPLQDETTFGAVIWTVGTACEVALLGALAVEAIRRRTARSMRRLLAPVAFERLVVHGMGPVVDRNRPARRGERPANIGPSSSSMPSGHTSSPFLAASLLARGRGTGLVAFALAGVAAASRLLLRVHRPSDVALSALAGVVVGRAVVRWDGDDGPDDQRTVVVHEPAPRS